MSIFACQAFKPTSNNYEQSRNQVVFLNGALRFHLLMLTRLSNTHPYKFLTHLEFL